MDNLNSPSDTGFVTEFDAIPGFWNYLVGLDRKDLIAELIQNDLDQGATRTVISFEKTRLVCDGNVNRSTKTVGNASERYWGPAIKCLRSAAGSASRIMV